MSVARVAQGEGVNSHQIFQWRRAYRQGVLGDAVSSCPVLLPVVVSGSDDDEEQEASKAAAHAESLGAIHIELPGRATITAESGADAHLLRAILEVLRQ
jgi:transposase